MGHVVSELAVEQRCLAPGPADSAGARAALRPTEEDRTRVTASVSAGRVPLPAPAADSPAMLLPELSEGS